MFLPWHSCTKLLRHCPLWSVLQTTVIHRLTEWHQAAMGREALGLQPMADEKTRKKKKEDRSQDKMPILHIQGVTFSFSYSDSVSEWDWQFVLISLCRLVVSPSSHLKCLGYDQTGSAVVSVCQHRLTFLPHEVSICCTWQAAGSAQFAWLVKSDTDKKRLGENWHTEENPRLQQIFDDVIFAGLEMEADVDICVTSAQSGRQSLSLYVVVSLPSLCLFLSFSLSFPSCFHSSKATRQNLIFIVLFCS